MATTASETEQQGIGVRDLLEAGLHFGHQTKRWNPKMKRYIFDKRQGIHIIDLAKSLMMLQEAMQFISETVSSGKSILFVGTKKQAQQVIKETATACGQHYVTHRWLGGTLTNSGTIRQSVRRYTELAAMEEKDGFASLHKKEAASLRRELEKLRRNLSGITEMSGLPGALFVIDINREAIAVAEARKLNVPVVAMVDTNCDPDPVDYVIPGNDDAIRAISLISGAVAGAIQLGLTEHERTSAEKDRQREAELAVEVKKASEEPEPAGGEDAPGESPEPKSPSEAAAKHEPAKDGTDGDEPGAEEA